jgi:YbbR domain-containing protein
MKKTSQSNWFYGGISLLFALLLFFNANATGNSTNTASQQTYEETLDNIPVHLEYDKDKYYVSGYEEAVSVHLSSANRVQLNLESNVDTRNFQVVADLSKVPVGTTEVPLTVKGLSSAVTAKMEPKTITVTVEKKVSQKYKVEAQMPDSIEKEGYKVDNLLIEPESVEITTGEETAKAITKVVAPITNTNQADNTIEQTLNVQALDDKGQVLSIENPAPQVKVTVDLIPPTKEVPLTIKMNGSLPAGISHYTYNLSKTSVTISGPQSVLNEVETIQLPIDISDVRSTKKQTVTVPVEGAYTVTPEKVEVTLEPVYDQKQSNSKGSANSTTSYSSSNQQGTWPSSSSQLNSNTSQMNESNTSETVENTEN